MATVGIVMGSDSDMPVMSKAAQILDRFGVSYDMHIISAHREPDVFFCFAAFSAASFAAFSAAICSLSSIDVSALLAYSASIVIVPTQPSSVSPDIL